MQEDVTDLDIQPAGSQCADQGDRPQRVAADVEEAVMYSDPRQPDDVGPGHGQPLLRWRAGRDEVGATADRPQAGRGQCGRVELSGGCQRDLVDEHERGGHHVGRQRAEQRRPQIGRIELGAVGNHVGDQRVVANHHHGVPHPGERGGRGGDLAQFDPVSPDLDLAVRPAEDLDVPVRQPASQVAAAVEPRPGRSERIRQEALGGQLRSAEVAAG